MKHIWKYRVNIADSFEIEMPYGAEILTVQLQDDWPYIWAIVNEQETWNITRHFRIIGTGNLFEKETKESNLIYIDTIQMPPFVWHLFEEITYGD